MEGNKQLTKHTRYSSFGGCSFRVNLWIYSLRLRKQFAKVRGEADELQGILSQTFSFDKMVSGMLDPEMFEDTAKIVNEAIKDKVQVNLIINNRAGGNGPLIAQKIASMLYSKRSVSPGFNLVTGIL
jgi:hypothetical protein